jgi:hypothetical protein
MMPYDVMEQKPNDRESKPTVAICLWVIALSVGTAAGAGIGAAIDHIGAGIAVGTGTGVAIGLVLYRRYSTSPSDH